MAQAITEDGMTIDIDLGTMSFHSRAVRYGMLLATVAETDSGREIRAPMFFGDRIVAEEGVWPILSNEGVEKAMWRVFDKLDRV